MKLPPRLLGTLAAAVTGLSLAGCYEKDTEPCQSPSPEVNVSTQPQGAEPTDCEVCPAVPNPNGPNGDSCPACGRG
jgi:hypothetical protein